MTGVPAAARAWYTSRRYPGPNFWVKMSWHPLVEVGVVGPPQFGVAALAVMVPAIARPLPTSPRVLTPATIFALTDIQILLGLLAQLPVTVVGGEPAPRAAASHIELLEAARRPAGCAAPRRRVSAAEGLERSPDPDRPGGAFGHE